MANLTDWLSFNTISGDSGTTTVNVSVTENAGDRNRVAIVGFSNQDELTDTLTITQYRQLDGDLPIVSPEELFYYKSGGTHNLTITYSKPFILDSIPDFLTIDAINAFESGYIYTITASANTTNNAKTGTININTPYGTVGVPVLQVTYNPTLTITPDEIIINETGGTQNVTVDSIDFSWSASTEADWITLSQYTGESGSTVVVVSGAPMDEIEQHTTLGYNGEVVFTNGEDTKILTVHRNNLATGGIDDDWVTAYYTITEEETGSDIRLIYMDCTDIINEPTRVYSTTGSEEDVYYIPSSSSDGMYDTRVVVENGFYILRSRFTSAGTYIVKYRFHDDIVIPHRAFADGDVRYGSSYIPVHVPNLTKLVVGNKCNGYIGAISCTNGNLHEVILGTGTLYLYCCSFKGAGSFDYDFILPSGVSFESVCSGTYEAMDEFKCKRFIIDQPVEGGLDTKEPPLQNAYDYAAYYFGGYCKTIKQTDMNINVDNQYIKYVGRRYDRTNNPHLYGIRCLTLMFAKNCTHIGDYVLYRYASTVGRVENNSVRTTSQMLFDCTVAANIATQNIIFLSTLNPSYDKGPFSRNPNSFSSGDFAFNFAFGSGESPTYTDVGSMPYYNYPRIVNKSLNVYFRTGASGTDWSGYANALEWNVSEFLTWSEIENL